MPKHVGNFVGYANVIENTNNKGVWNTIDQFYYKSDDSWQYDPVYSGSAPPILNTSDGLGQTLSSGVRSDPNASSLELALPLTTAGGNSLTLDAIPSGRTSSAKTVTANNISNSSSVYKFYGNASLNTTTNPSYYGLPSRIIDYAQSFTIEFWVYRPSGVGAGVFSDSNGPSGGGLLWFSFGISSAGNLTMYSYPSSTGNSTTGTVPADQWSHVAFVKDGSTMTYFIDGTKDSYTHTFTSPGGSTSTYQAMYTNNGVYYQDYRMYVGLAKYTANFTP